VETTYPDRIRIHLIVPGASFSAGPTGFVSVWLDPDHSVRRLLGARETALALLRPDGYLGYRSQPASWDGLGEYLDRFLIEQSGRAGSR
jgi:hypothetical protein